MLLDIYFFILWKPFLICIETFHLVSLFYRFRLHEGKGKYMHQGKSSSFLSFSTLMGRSYIIYSL